MKVLLLLVLLTIFSTASANPCNLPLNSTPEQDYAAIVVYGCDPFKIMHKRRLGRPRVQQTQQLDIADALLMSGGLNSLGFGGSTTGGSAAAAGSTGTTNNGNNGLQNLMMLDAMDVIDVDMMDDPEDLIMINALTGGQGLNANTMTQMALMDGITLKKANPIHKDEMMDAREQNSMKSIIHALTSGPQVTQEQLSTAAKLSHDMRLRKANHVRRRHQLRRTRATAAAAKADTAQTAQHTNDLFGDMGDMMEDHIEMQQDMAQARMISQMMRGRQGAGATSPSPAMSQQMQPSVASVLPGAAGLGGLSGLMNNPLVMASLYGDRRLRSPRAAAKTDATNKAQMNDGIKSMMWMQALAGANGGTLPASAMMVEDSGDLPAAMAMAQMNQGGMTGGASGMTGDAGGMMGGMNLQTLMMMDGDVGDAFTMGALTNMAGSPAAASASADSSSATSQSSAANPMQNMMQTAMIADATDADDVMAIAAISNAVNQQNGGSGNVNPMQVAATLNAMDVGRRLRRPRVRVPRPRAKLVPIYRKLQ